MNLCMFRNTVLVVLFVLSIMVAGCGSSSATPKTSEGETSNVRFSFSDFAPVKKVATNYGTPPTMKEVDSIMVTIKDSFDNIVFDRKKIDLITFSGEYTSSNISIAAGDYTLTAFFVLNGTEAVYVTPINGSPMAGSVRDPLPINFSVDTETEKNVFVQVVSAEPEPAIDFGYLSFSFEAVDYFYISVRENVTSPNWTITDSTITISSNGDTLLTKELSATTQKVYIPIEREYYTLHITKTGYKPFEKTYIAEELYPVNDMGNPLPVLVNLAVSDTPRIVFQSNRDGTNQLYSTDTDGTNQTRLTFNESNDIKPSCSFNGSKIAFYSDRDGNYEIYIMDAKGNNQTRLTDNEFADRDPSLSPDGSRIAFQSNQDGNYEIYVMNSDGSNLTRLTNNEFIESGPTWSPDGSKIAYQSNQDGNYEIYVIDTDGKIQIRLTTEDGVDARPNFSPDGSKIAFQSNRDGNYEIYVMDIYGNNQTRLTLDGTIQSGPTWSPDGSKIAYQSNKDGNYDIFVMDTDGANQTRLFDSDDNESNPSWLP